MTNQSLKTRKLNPKTCRFKKSYGKVAFPCILQYFSKKVFFKTPVVTASGQMSVFCTLHLSHASNWSTVILLIGTSGLRPATLLKTRLLYRCFPVNFAKFSRTPFSQNTSGWLLLHI